MKPTSLYIAANALLLLALTHGPNTARAAEKAAPTATSKRPNIVVIVADDLGYADIGVQGNKDIPTPNVDSLAHSGIRFTSGYVSGPYCSPTRAGFLTGRYQQRYGHEFNPAGAGQNDDIGLSLKETTIADRLKAAGYVTGLVGKWHEGQAEKFNPINRGFSEYFGFLGGAHSYTNLNSKGANPIQRGLQPVEEKEYLTDAFKREAVSFIDRHQKEPFFLYLAFNAVHSPLDLHPKYYDRFKDIADPKRRRFASLLAALDDGVGAVREKLRAAGLEENTLVVFFSDNGGPTADNTSRNDPLRGFKATTWEGGVRVPFIISWKGKLPENKVDDRPIIQLDLLPTALAAAGVDVKPEWKLDGVNLLPYLTGANTARPHETLYWRFGQQIAIRKGDWKLVKGNERGGRPVQTSDEPASTKDAELYNLATDISESTNLAAKEPAKLKELAAAWDTWNKDLVPPAWGPGAPRARNGNRQGNGITSNATKTGPWKQGDLLASADAPQIAGHALTVSAEIEATKPNGVIVAQGAATHGYSLFLQDGKLTFAVRVAGELSAVTSKDPLPAGKLSVKAGLATDGRLTLSVNGKEVGNGRASGLIANQPADGFSVGSDANAPVGNYETPNAFAGRIENVRVETL